MYFTLGKPFRYPGDDGHKPAVPCHTEKPQMGAKSSRDFVTTNAVNTITSVPRKAQPKYVDTATGCTHDLEVRTDISIFRCEIINNLFLYSRILD